MNQSNSFYRTVAREPRVSWFGTPLYNCDCIVITINVIHDSYTREINYYPTAEDTGRFGHISSHTIYLTPEEFVMWKMQYDDDKQDYDLEALRKNGIVYS